MVSAGPPQFDPRRSERSSSTLWTPRQRVRAWVAAGAVIAASVASGALWLSARAQPDPERLWVDAERAFRAGRWNEARAGLLRIERLRSKTARDWLLEAQLASADDRTDRALEALAHVPETDFLAGQANLMAGRLERARNHIRTAEAYYRKALTADPGLIDARRELIYIYGVQLRRREIDAEFRALGKLTPLNHHDLFTWALTHFTSWRPDIATDLRAYVDADPEDRASRLALVENLLDQPDQETNVLQLLDALPKADPDALALRVSLALHLGRLDEARSLLEQAPPNHSALAKFRGRLAMIRHDPTAAVEHFRRALSDEPYDRVSNAELARALILDNKAEEAEVYATRARRLDEVYKLVIRIRSADQESMALDLTSLGSACALADLTEEARHWYALAVSRDPLDSRAQQGLYRLSHPKTDAEAIPPGPVR
jgi:tetratricopeptide (TPR) repeat protein